MGSARVCGNTSIGRQKRDVGLAVPMPHNLAQLAAGRGQVCVWGVTVETELKEFRVWGCATGGGSGQRSRLGLRLMPVLPHPTTDIPGTPATPAPASRVSRCAVGNIQCRKCRHSVWACKTVCSSRGHVRRASKHRGDQLLGSGASSPNVPAQLAVVRDRVNVHNGRGTRKWGDWRPGGVLRVVESERGRRLLSGEKGAHERRPKVGG